MELSFVILLWVLSPTHALVFVAVHQAVFALCMGCSFAPNHKGMPSVAAHEKLDYLRRKVLGSRNLRGGWFVDQLLGGLNCQVELPRPLPRRAQPLVRGCCAQRAISDTETGLFRSYGVALRHLHSLGQPRRSR